MRRTGKQRLSDARWRAKARRAKMRGRRAADRMGLRGGRIHATVRIAWWRDATHASRLVWESLLPAKLRY